jgi:hypothetical protein
MVPDLNLPPNMVWTAQLTDHGVPVIEIHHNGLQCTLFMVPIGRIGGSQAYIVQMPKRLLQFLRGRLGNGRVQGFRKAMVPNGQLKRRVRDLGFGKVRRKSDNRPINVHVPGICGQSSFDHDLGDDETEDDLDVITELE